MKIGIMQPYFLPYIGYFQLINSVDLFVVYDNIKFTKKGWINRNRYILNGRERYFTISLKKDSDFLNVSERIISEEFDKERTRIVRKIENAYYNAPFYSNVMPLIKACFLNKQKNLFSFVFESIKLIAEFLEISTPIKISSDIETNESLKGADRVIEICRLLDGNEYLNPIGGIELYNKELFSKNGIKLHFIKSQEIIYNQFNYEFVPNLSIIDVLMFNEKKVVKKFLCQFELI